MSLLAILSSACAYIAIAIACTPLLVRASWESGGETKEGAVRKGVFLALIWPFTGLAISLAISFAKGLDWAERHIFGDEGTA